MKTCVIDTGGGLRGIYASGVLDRCIELGVNFDVAIGISAGSANVSSFLAGQQKRNYRFYIDYSGRKKYMSVHNFITKKSYIDLDYIYGTLSNSDGEDPLDYDAFTKNKAEFITIATNAITGEAKYFDRSDMAQDRYDVFKASSCIPFVCRPYFINGVPYYDGALSDTIPIQKAFDMGCDKVVLIITKPKDVIRTPGSDKKLGARIRRKYPKAADAISARADRYNAGVAAAKEYEKQGKLLLIAPDDICGMDTLTRDVEAMKKLYEKGIHDADRIPEFLACGR